MKTGSATAMLTLVCSLFSVQAHALNGECGLTGSTGSRIHDCAKLRYCPIYAPDHDITCLTSGPDAGELSWTNPGTHQTIIWKLVARQYDPSIDRFHEVWQDSHAMKLWGDNQNGLQLEFNGSYFLYGSYMFSDFAKLGSNGEVISDGACGQTSNVLQSSVIKKADVGVSDTNWGVPSIEEWKQASTDGISEVLDNMHGMFWSLSSDPYNPEAVQVLWGDSETAVNYVYGTTSSAWQNDFGHFRCIGR